MSFLGTLFKKIENRHLILDITSGTVGGIVISKNESGQINVLKTYREIFPFNKPLGGKSIHTTMLGALNKVMHELSKTSGRVNSVHFIMSSPWITSETKNVLLKFDKPTIVSEHVVKKAIKDEEERFSKTLNLESNRKEKVTIIESKITDIKVNGYSVETVLGETAKELQISFFVSLSTERVTDEIKKEMYRHYRISNIQFHSSAISTLLFLDNLGIKSQDIVFMNIHGEVTELAHVNHGRIVGWGSIPVGTRTLMRKYAERSRVSNHLALSDISLVVTGLLTDTAMDTKKDNLEKVQEDWIKGVKETLMTFIDELAVPQIYYIYADFGMKKAFADILSKKILKDLGYENPGSKIEYIDELDGVDGILKQGVKAISNLIK